MLDPAQRPEAYNAAVAASLRAVRRLRRLRQADVADALGMSRRTYVDLEAGQGRATFDQLIAFADVTDSDRFALVAAILFAQPSLAVRCADNKMMQLMALAALDFDAAAVDQLPKLSPREVMRAFEDTFRRLKENLSARSEHETDLLARLTGSLPEVEAD